MNQEIRRIKDRIEIIEIMLEEDKEPDCGWGYLIAELNYLKRLISK